MNATIVVVLIAAGWAVYYTSSCLFWPYANCRRCKGNGKARAMWGGKAFRRCGRCGGTGRRLRLGRRLFNLLRQSTNSSRSSGR